MLTAENIEALLNNSGNVLSPDGTKIGSIGHAYADDETGQPEWVTVKTGLFGTSESFVPLEGARVEGSDLVVPYEKDLVKDAPRVDVDGHLERAEEDRLYTHYQRGGGIRTYTDAAATDDAMTRSEEQVNVHNEKQATGRARLRKYVTTENVTQTVPAKREE